MALPDGRLQSPVPNTRECIAFVLIDGLADIHIPDMANLTPLEAADTPTLDAVAGQARCRKIDSSRQHANELSMIYSRWAEWSVRSCGARAGLWK